MMIMLADHIMPLVLAMAMQGRRVLRMLHRMMLVMLLKVVHAACHDTDKNSEIAGAAESGMNAENTENAANDGKAETMIRKRMSRTRMMRNMHTTTKMLITITRLMMRPLLSSYSLQLSRLTNQ